MKYPLTCSKIYHFDRPIVYIFDGEKNTIGWIQMNDDDAMNAFTKNAFPVYEETENIEDKKE